MMLRTLLSQIGPWCAWGFGIGLTALGLAWFTGKRLGVTGGFVDACSLVTKKNSDISWKFFFILGLPLGGAIATARYWSWTFLFGQLDALTMGSLFLKFLWLFIGGLLVGYGARWAGGCVSGNSIMGIPMGSKMSILATVGFLTAGILTAHMIFKFFGVS